MSASQQPGQPIRLSSVMGVARALLGTFDATEAVEILIVEFGWDVTFQSLVLLRGVDAEKALLLTMERLLTDDMAHELDRLGRSLNLD